MQGPHLTASEERLWRLIAERARPEADKERIDRRLWDLFGVEQAVMFTDLAGFSRRVRDFGITHFLQVIHESHALLLPVVEKHDGILVKIEADSLLITFRRARRALDCALEMQRACARTNRDRAPEEQILLCLGIGYGDMLRVGESEIWGNEVNHASKLGEDTASAGEVLLTNGAVEQLGDVEGVRFEQLDDEVAGFATSFRAHYSVA